MVKGELIFYWAMAFTDYCPSIQTWQGKEDFVARKKGYSLTIYQVAIVLHGRQAGKKVVVIKQHDEGSKERPYPHAIVAGVERYPRKVTRRMGQKKLASRSKVKPFIKVRLDWTTLESVSDRT